MKSDPSEVESLRAAIAKLTGYTPQSMRARYLRERLAEIKAAKAAGENVKRRNDPAAVVSVSMPTSAREVLTKMVERDQTTPSKLVRAALALYAKEHDHKDAEVFL